MQMQDTEELKVQLRKNQDTLKIVGQGVIAFGIWSIVKTVLSSALSWSSIREQMDAPGVSDAMLVSAFVFVMAVLLAIVLLIRLYIGRAGIAEGRGQRRGGGYIVAAFLLAGVDFTLQIFSLAESLRLGGRPLMDMAITLVVELTSCITLVEMGVSAIRVRKLRRLLEPEEG